VVKPSIGRIVHYVLNEDDARQINRRRTTEPRDKWPIGAQAHIGNVATPGDVLPMVIVRVWGESEQSAVNGQVLLDGADTLWVSSRCQVTPDSTDKQGLWFEPPRV
jgi:hypothetical protein